jgi:hypothetical protein
VSDLEARLRDAVTRRSLDYEPASDLPDRIAARVAHRRRVRRAATGTALVAAAAAVVMGVVLILPDAERGSVRVDDGPSPVTTAPAPTTDTPTTSTTPTLGPDSAKSVADVERPPPSVPAITPLTPLSRHGIGPITAGMTLREAQQAAGVGVVAGQGGDDACVEAHLEGIDDFTVLVVEPASTGDPMDGVVRAVAGSVIPTDEGAHVGQTRDDLLVALGEPTRREAAPGPWGSDAELLVFEAGGYAYGALVTDGMVLGLQSGDPAWVGDPEGCPG